MKGVFIHNQLEIRVEVAGEEFSQGDEVSCTLSVGNHANEGREVQGRLELVLGDCAKVKKKSDTAVQTVSAAELGGPFITAPQEKESRSWSFFLDRNCAVSEKSQSLYVLYGEAGDSGALELLPLSVKPHTHIQQVLMLLESSFQFVVRGVKSSHGWVNARCRPPAARRYSFVEELTLGFHFDPPVMQVKYSFRVKKIQASSSSVGVKKGRTEVAQTLAEQEYLLSGDHINHRFFEEKIEEALSEVVTGL